MKRNGAAHAKEIRRFVKEVKNLLSCEPPQPNPRPSLNEACRQVVADTSFKWDTVKQAYLRGNKEKEKSHGNLVLNPSQERVIVDIITHLERTGYLITKKLVRGYILISHS